MPSWTSHAYFVVLALICFALALVWWEKQIGWILVFAGLGFVLGVGRNIWKEREQGAKRLQQAPSDRDAR